MRLSNIISTSLSENDDDMFPGVGSSVFDDTKAKDQPEHDPNNLVWIKDQMDKYGASEKLFFRRRQRILNDMGDNGALNTYPLGVGPKANAIMYKSFDWFDKYDGSGINFYHGIEKSSPYLKDIENKARLLYMYSQREQGFRDKRLEIEDIFHEYVKREKDQKKGKT